MDPEKGAFFNDRKRRTDFVLLIQASMDVERENYKLLQEYLSNLKSNGLEVEIEKGQVLEDTSCIKIHAPNTVLDKAMNQYNVDVSCDNIHYRKDEAFTIFGLNWFHNYLMKIKPDDELFQRAPKTFPNEKPTDYTTAERILLVEKILSDTPFSENSDDVGYKMLKRKGGIETAYPLHDSTSRWDSDPQTPLSDRQILRRFWAHPLRFYQQQPLNLVEKYYGSEVGFYFAWLGFYTTMLVPAAILGVICSLCAIVIYVKQREVIITEICESEQMLCPVCPRYEVCGLQPLKNSCELFKISFVLDNPATVVYSIFMCFWGITFLVLWKRKQAMLKFRWNLNDINVDNAIRPEFIKSAPIWRISSITGQMEYIFPRWLKISAYFLTFLGYLFMIILYVLGILAVMYVRLNLLYYGKKSKNANFKQYLSLIETLVSAFLTIIVMMILDSFKKRIAEKMTSWQNPRTKVGYERSYTKKIVIFSLAAVFFPIFYLAYFKGHFYEHPGDATQWTFLGLIKADVCTIYSCLVELSIQLFAILLTKNFIRIFVEMLLPMWEVFFNQLFFQLSADNTVQSYQWENEYLLIEPKPGFLYSEYISMIVQYGFMTFFIAALPITPILALLNNILELRLDARKMLVRYRRIIPKKVNGIEEWNTVLHLITVLGAISNPLLLAYSSNLIPKSIYLAKHHWSLSGYINSTLSEFDVADYLSDKHRGLTGNPEVCQYYGKRYPPNHSQRYEHTPDFWQEMLYKTIFFVVLENLCLLLSLLLTYVIPEIPRKVEIKLLEDQRLLRNTKLQRSRSQSSLLRVKRDGTLAGPSRIRNVKL